MLSAVAARKARLSQSQAQIPLQSTPTTPSAPCPPPPSDTRNKLSSTLKPPSKRKSVAPAGNAAKRRKSRSRKTSPSHQSARYFSQPDVFKTQDDVIVVDGTDSETSSTSPDILSEDEDPHIAISHHNSRTSARQRPWSPSAPLPDSSDEEAGGMDDPVILDMPIPPREDSVFDQPSSTLSTFRPVLNQNVFCLAPSHIRNSDEPLRKRTVLLLAASNTVALLGTYSISVLQGAVTLGGVTLIAPSASLSVFAPRSAPVPIIRCVPLEASASNPSALQNLPSEVANAAKSFDAVIILQELQTGIEGLGKICRTFDGFFAPSRWHRDQVRFDLGLDTVYFLSHQMPDIFPLDVPPSWDAAIGALYPTSSNESEVSGQRSAYLIRGPKNTGKTTFARLMLNRLLSKFQRVAYLECDLGQSEFTPGGMVSLNVVDQPIFGPPFSHPSIPYTAHYVGATSPKTSPSHYVDSIQALVQLYDLDIQNPALEESDLEDGRIRSFIPLIVNTMGWTKGLGGDLARKLEDIVQPSHIFSFDASANDDWGSPIPVSGSSGLGGPHVHSLESVRPSSISCHYTAADQRNLSMLSYFHAIFPNHPPTSLLTSPIAMSWNATLPLCAQHPYEVDARTGFDRLFLAGAGTEDVVPAEVLRALTCSVVGLVSCQPGTLDSHSHLEADDGEPALPFYEQGSPPPSPYTSKCLGLAVVRAISPAPSPRIQLLTPVPPNLLGSARVLIMGELRLPVWGMLDFRTLDDGGDIAGYERGKVPYLRWGKGEGAGGERRRVRRNLMRRGQM
ncbi:hypothetical protein LXA43DRAFT_603955 [Ganoderma leucocontextum]|nr:hypothetical protein LXA43DRAFT_603955 [Ganoderma leucocontextum]